METKGEAQTPVEAVPVTDLYRLGLYEDLKHLGGKVTPDASLEDLLAIQDLQREYADNLGLTLPAYLERQREILAGISAQIQATVKQVEAMGLDEEDAPISGSRYTGETDIEVDYDEPLSA